MNQETLLANLEYRPETGKFLWKKNKKGGVRIGDIAGSADGRGYIRIKIQGARYFAHRLVWLYLFGKWPDQQIDHINGVQGDNRLENLRDVSAKQNTQNQSKPRKWSKSQLIGVSWNSAQKKWQAQIGIDGKMIYLGLFDDAIDAHKAYLCAKENIHSGFIAGQVPLYTRREA